MKGTYLGFVAAIGLLCVTAMADGTNIPVVPVKPDSGAQQISGPYEIEMPGASKTPAKEVKTGENKGDCDPSWIVSKLKRLQGSIEKQINDLNSQNSNAASKLGDLQDQLMAVNVVLNNSPDMACSMVSDLKMSPKKDAIVSVNIMGKTVTDAGAGSAR